MQSVTVKRWGLLIALVVLLVLFFVSGLYRYFTLSMLQQHHHDIQRWAHTHWFLAVLAFIVCYIIAVALSFPGATILTLAGGFIFGIVGGSILVIISATIGAIVPFIAARTALADTLREKAGGRLKRFEEGFRRDQASYLLVLRLVPLFPFWFVNIAGGLLDVRLRTFAWTTFVGIIPGSVVYVAVGNGLSTVIASGNDVNLDRKSVV